MLRDARSLGANQNILGALLAGEIDGRAITAVAIPRFRNDGRV